MIRRVVALLAACVAAPYLTMLLLIIDPSFGPGIKMPVDLLIAVLLGTVALLYLGLPLLCVAGLLAAVLHGRGWEARWQVGLTACLLGACFVGLFHTEELKKSLAPLFEGGLAGAICGWIYWRIVTTGHQSL